MHNSQCMMHNLIKATAAIAAVAFFIFSAEAEECRMVYGQVYTERNDDLSYENDVVAFRIYGPETQRRGEKSYGYDIFVKYPDSGIVLPYLYGEQCSPSNWAKVDSLKKIDKGAAKAFEDTFTYHIDHGKGADCYAVGPTLGCGVAALLDEDGKIRYPWCYESVEILENGPERFEAMLSFAPVVIGQDTVTERRRIVLEKGSYLNLCEVSYEGLSHPYSLVAGVPRRDDGEALMDAESGVLAYADPTQRNDSGKIFTGIILPGGAEEMLEDQGHILAKTTLNPGEKFQYYWGNSWSKGRIATFEEWKKYLKGFLSSQSD